MKKVLSGLTLLMILSLTACGSLIIEGKVVPAAEVTSQELSLPSRSMTHVEGETADTDAGAGLIGANPTEMAGGLTSTQTSAGEATSVPTVPTQEPSIVDTLPAQCMEALEHRELKEPYQRDKHTNEARYTLSADELNAYLSAMGIESLCIPAGLGAPFLNADWSSASMIGTVGRMISLGFENLYDGAGWSQGFVLFSTYDFAAPTEYDIYATAADRDAVRQGTMSDRVEVNGVAGFMHIRQSPICFGQCGIDKTFVFPFETYYVAVVYRVGYCAADDNAACESVIQALRAGDYPPAQQVNIAMMDSLASTIRFYPQP